jgi:hypothetical protein
MLIINLNNNRSKPLAFHRQGVYQWHLIHTDKDIDMMPKKRKETIRLRMFRALETPFGKGFDNLSSAGPP